MSSLKNNYWRFSNDLIN